MGWADRKVIAMLSKMRQLILESGEKQKESGNHCVTFEITVCRFALSLTK